MNTKTKFANAHLQAVAASVSTHRHSTIRNPGRRVGRNDPCPCGNGKKAKQCFGLLKTPEEFATHRELVAAEEKRVRELEAKAQ